MITPKEIAEAEERRQELHLEVLICKQALQNALSLEAGAEGRLLTLKAEHWKEERAALVEQRQDANTRAMMAGLNAVEQALQPREKLTAEEHNAFPLGRF